ncbi:RNA polymerase sigma-70 factor (ECF subfamily) [Nonomuraea thailandensis]|uniref:RNA polymerase sigma-70 factor (ECF subfamily) n=1 Tax=Nonomuraea thailandensis TaxID=1188745 RepID=A0A9X2K2K1_9ACTN|nr:RNA polymerase sigma factor [Nonomuraea thailandensis]MCP2358462.1 RNA polymerase sigma-70 factor (ECF subfamily) [Nonomuraea thailandensis]
MNVPAQLGLDLDRIFDAHFAEIHRYIAQRLSRDDADDLAGEVFLIAAGGGYESSRGEVRPWLYGIATKLISRHRRSEIRRWRALSRTSEREAQSHEDTTLTRVTAGRLTGRLAAALAGLNSGDRDVVLLVALGELTHQEVAAALKIPYGTVASRLNRARKQLRKALGDVNPLKETHGG